MAKFSFWSRIITASVVAVSMSVILTGCSATRLGYNKLPEIASWWLDSYIDFTDSQGPQAKVALQKLQAWHRKEELPAIAELLVQAQTLAPQNITPEQACKVWESAQVRIESLIQESSRLAAPVVSQLSAKQLKHLEKEWASRNEDWKKNWLQGTPDTRIKKRVDLAAERFNSFYGDLNLEQRQVLKQQFLQSTWTPETSYQLRLKRQQEQLIALQAMSSEITKPAMPLAQVEKTLQALILQSVRPKDAGDLSKQLQIEQQACQNLAQLHNTMSPAQRLKAQRKLKDYETDVRELMKI
jgi:signal transduction histidine kinase